MNTKTACICVFLTIFSAPAMGGGEAEEGHFDIFLGRPAAGSQTLIGGALVPDDLNLDERIFEGDLETDAIAGNNFYTTTEPGFFNAGANSPGLLGATNPAGALPLNVGEGFSVSSVPYTLDGTTAELFYWNGTGGVTFAPSSAELIITQTDGMAGSDGSIDDHPIYDIDLPASNDLPAGGIYLAAIQAQLAGLQPSDIALVLFVTGEEFEESVELAEEYLAGKLIPEPSALALLAMASLMGLVRLRR